MATRKKLPTWRIISHEGRYLGTVQAATADEAIKIAIRDFSMSEAERRGRVVAQKIGTT
jgi:hypothetical protein